jgi:hypothetical protein
MQIQYGNHAIDTATLPPTSIDAMVRRGVSHYLGNEMASKVVAWEESQTKENGRAPSPEEKAAKKEALQLEAIAALEAGTVGQSNRGPRVDPLIAQINIIAKREVLNTLRANNIKPPKGDEVIAFGDAKRTMAQMIERRIASPKFGPAIEAEAKKFLADQAKKAEKAKRDAAARDPNVVLDADELGV